MGYTCYLLHPTVTLNQFFLSLVFTPVQRLGCSPFGEMLDSVGQHSQVEIPTLQSGSSVAEIEAFGEITSFFTLPPRFAPFVLVKRAEEGGDGAGYL